MACLCLPENCFTNFSLGLAIPSGYGNTWIKVGDEVKRNLHLGINMSDFFVGENFKVHPQWVYCKYHYLEGHEFDTPEAELRHFLKKLTDPYWKWSQQYEVEPKYQLDGVPDNERKICIEFASIARMIYIFTIISRLWS